MRARGGLIVAVVLVAGMPAVAWAGMPSPFPVLTDWGMLRVGAILFFVMVLLGLSSLVCWLWNVLSEDFPRLPPLTYRKALAAVLLLSVALGFVLTMIAGARELLTPGAWKPQGLLYTLDQQEAAKPPEAKEPPAPPTVQDRQANLERLKMALLQYAATHGGEYPAADEPALADAPWTMPDELGMRYVYVGGRTANQGRKLLAFEPAAGPGPRLVLYTDGHIASLSAAELRRQVDAEETP